MDDFNLYDLFFSEEVAAAHELVDSEREPYVEEPEPTSLLGRTFYVPFRSESSGWFGSC